MRHTLFRDINPWINGLKARVLTALRRHVATPTVRKSYHLAQPTGRPSTHLLTSAWASATTCLCIPSFLISVVLHAASPRTQVNDFLHPPSAFMLCFHDLRLSFACFSLPDKRPPWRSLLY